jgi:hypothetical protein
MTTTSAREQPMSLQELVEDLRARVARLESGTRRTSRGHCNMRQAAEYLGHSREWLRQRHLRGEGPARNPDGSYSYDQLDAFKEAS